MMNHKNRKSWRTVTALVMAIALLPIGALALTEDTLEPAPENAETVKAAVPAGNREALEPERSIGR